LVIINPDSFKADSSCSRGSENEIARKAGRDSLGRKLNGCSKWVYSNLSNICWFSELLLLSDWDLWAALCWGN